MSEPLNPWDHAEVIARRLLAPDAEFLTVIGASGWCQRCQRLQPRFERLSIDLPSHVVPMWLDLEEHAEFLDDFIPPDLPLLLRWRRGTCVQAAIIETIEPEAPTPQRVKLLPLELHGASILDPNQGSTLMLPWLWRRFAMSGETKSGR